MGNGDLLGFGLEKVKARAKNRKTQFLGARARGPETGGKSYHAIRDGCPQLFYIFRFGRPDPMGGKSQNMGFLGHFGLGRPWTLREMPGPGQNRKNTNSWCKGSQNGKKMLPRYPGWLSATFLHVTFWPNGPQGAGNREIRGFWAILAVDGHWHLEKSRA